MDDPMAITVIPQKRPLTRRELIKRQRWLSRATMVVAVANAELYVDQFLLVGHWFALVLAIAWGLLGLNHGQRAHANTKLLEES